MDLKKRLEELRDDEYAAFQARIVPTVAPERIIGVRVPAIRELGKEAWKNADVKKFMQELPHKYYEEDMLHAVLLTKIKDKEEALLELERFLPYVDNWAVCDTMRINSLKKDPQKLIEKAREWINSEETYTCRFGIKILMDFFLDKDFDEKYLRLPETVISEEYYVNMMIAWYYATALAKQWDATLPVIAENRLGKWVHNKTIQKAKESFRVTDEHKKILNSMKR